MPSDVSAGGGQARPPAMYEDRTLFPTPITEQPHPEPPPPRTGLSAAGVLLVAVFAAAVAAVIVWFATQTSNTGGSASPQVTELENTIADLEAQLQEYQASEVADQIAGLENQIETLTADLEARIEASSRYREIESLEADIAEGLEDIDLLLAEPERQRMPPAAKEVDPAPAWIADTEQELRDYLDYINERIEQITTWPARNPLPPCSDPENC